MPVEQKIVSVAVALFFLIVVLELVRKRKLREEYSFLWVLIAVIVFILAAFDPVLNLIIHVFKVKAATSIVYMLGIIFLMMINLQFSALLSNFKNSIKQLTQKIALLEAELQEYKKSK